MNMDSTQAFQHLCAPVQCCINMKDRCKNGGPGVHLLLHLFRAQTLSVCGQVGLEVHSPILTPSNVLKGGAQHSWQDPWIFGGS